MKKESTIVANWKMYKTKKEAETFFSSFIPQIQQATSQIGFSVPYTLIEFVKELVKDTHIKVGAQNVYYELEGAFTGEISIPMLKDVGADFTIIGHSERRKVFFETNAMIQAKMQAALNNDLAVILCIGETLKEREEKLTFKVLEEQLNFGFKDLPQKSHLVTLAYEPVWAIGTGLNASADIAEECHLFCRRWLEKNKPHFKDISILYGGSVKPENASELLSQKNINGLLVGGASLKPDVFANIVNSSPHCL